MSLAIRSGQPGRARISSVRSWWPNLSLARQFTLASSALVLLGLGILGLWVSQKIEAGVKSDAAARTALYMESVIAPHLQELAFQKTLHAESEHAIDAIMAKNAERLRVVDAKIWSRDGVVLYALDKALIGQKFPPTPSLSSAWRGNVEAHFEVPHHLGDHGIAIPGGDPLLEIYAPMRRSDTGAVIAVAEFYELTTDLRRELRRTQVESWVVTGLVSLSIILGLYSIVANGSKTIETQRMSLANRVGELSDLLKQNEDLRQHVQDASRRSAEAAELQLRRLGADLHDGPAQLLALALLKLDNAFEEGAADRSRISEAVRGVLSDAMSEIRDISGGLALPEIEKLSLTQALMLVAAEHERRTSTTVSCEFPGKAITLSHPVKLCLCRFVQEGLSNAYRHAAGAGQRVTATWSDSMVIVEVSDSGPGLGNVRHDSKRPSLGIVGLRNRLESFGGRLTLTSDPGKGTRLTAYLPINA